MATPIPVKQTRLLLLYGKKRIDMMESLAPDLISFTYDDKETDEAEEISITLKDTDGKWAGNWQPNGGEVIRAFIMPGDIEGAKGSLNCGTFYIDEITASGSPRTVALKAVSIPLSSPLRRNLLTRAWEKQNLQNIASQIAAEGGLKLFFDSETNPEYDREEQNRESNLKFLSRLCEDAGLSIKVTSQKLVIFDQASYEKKEPIKTLTLGKSDILNWSFSVQQSETYKTCTVKYCNPQSKIVWSYTYTDELADENGQEYTVNQRVTTEAEAQQLAKATLRKLNARKATGNITIIGDISLVAGAVIKCVGFGKFDGNFIIETASHSVGSGYTTALTLRRVNSSY